MYKNAINFVIGFLEKHTILRYIVSGGTSAVVNIALFYVFYSFFNIYYIVSNIIAFTFAFFVSLFLQKFWTFRDHATENMHIQGVYYLLSSVFSLGLNTLILYICVDIFNIMPILGVIIAGGITALFTFQISSRLIFNRNVAE